MMTVFSKSSLAVSATAFLFMAFQSYAQGDFFWEAESAASTSGFSPFTVKTDDPLASAGAYVVWPSGSTDTSPADSDPGQMHFPMTIDSTTHLSFYVRSSGRQEWNGYDDMIYYKIEGLDSAWTKADTLDRVGWDWCLTGVRTNVPPGNYTLKILKGDDGTKLDAFCVIPFTEPLLRPEANIIARPPKSGLLNRLSAIWPSRTIEAENRLQNSPDTGLSTVSDATSSGGKYITYAAGAVDTTPSDANDGQAWYVVHLDTEETLDIWVRARLTSTASDSFWYKLADADTSWQLLESTDADWCWYHLGTYADVARGSRVLKLLKREPGAQIDQVFFSVDGSKPTGARTLSLEAEAPENSTGLAPLAVRSDDARASQHGYLTYPSGTANTVPDDADPGQASYTVSVQTPSLPTLTLWAHVLTPSGSGTFYYKITGLDSGWRTQAGTQSSWGWINLASYPSVSAGTRTLKLLYGTADVKIDRFFISTDGTAPPVLYTADLGSSARYVVPPPLGSDTNNGTAAAPWATLEHAFATLGPAQKLYIRGGTYIPSTVLNLTQNGTADNWCEVAPYPGEQAVIDGSAIDYTATQANYGLVRIQGEYIAIRDMTIQNSSHVGLSFNGSPGIAENCRIEDCWSSGIYWGGTGARIISNLVVYANSKRMDPGPSVDEKPPHEAIHGGSTDHAEVAYNTVCFGDKEGIDTLSGRNIRIHHNEIHHHYNYPYVSGIYLDAWNPVHNVEIYNNWVHDNGTGISINSEASQPMDNIRIHHNQLKDLFWVGGISVDNYGDSEEQTRDVSIWNNTFVNTLMGVLLSSDFNIAGEPHIYNIDIRNNIFVSQRQTMIKYDGASVATIGLTVAYNLFDATKIGVLGTDAIQASPRFINPTYDDFHLATNSPAINTGDPSARYLDPDLTLNDRGALPTGITAMSTPASPSNPDPADGSTGISRDAILSWLAPPNADTQTVFYSPDSPPAFAETLDPTVSHFGRPLEPNTIYQWQVSAQNSSGSTDGPVWSFKTTAPSSALVVNGDFSLPLLKNSGSSSPDSNGSPGWHRPFSDDSATPDPNDVSRWDRDTVNNYVYCDDNGWGKGMLQLIENNKVTTGNQTFSIRVKNTEGDGTANLLKAYVWGVNGNDWTAYVSNTTGPRDANGVGIGTKLAELNLGGTTYDWKTVTANLALGTGYDWIVILLWSDNCTPSAGDLCYVDDVAITGGNHFPAFSADSLSRSDAAAAQAYSATLAGSATDADSESLTYSKLSGPAWLQVAASGTRSGTPDYGDVGVNTFVVSATDPRNGFDQVWLTINVTAGSGYSNWAAGISWGAMDTDPLADPDNDGLNNFYEYALRGDPIHATDQNIFRYGSGQTNGTNWFDYIYNRRITPGNGLTYTLELTTNLVNGIWITNSYVTLPLAPLDADFEFVTNRININDIPSQFIRLRIE